MILAQLGVVALVLQGSGAPRRSDHINVSRQIISIELPDLTLADALDKVFMSAHLSYSFDPDALVVAKSLRRTGSFKGVTINDVLLGLLDGYNHGHSILEIRKQDDAYVIGQPLVSLDISKESAEDAVSTLLRQGGCDYCAEVTQMRPRQVSIHMKNVPLQEAFRRLMTEISPREPYQLTFQHGHYIVNRATSQARTLTDINNCDVVANIRSHGRLEAIAAVCDCLQRGYIIAFDGPLSGTVTVGDETHKGWQLVRQMLAGSSDKLTYSDDGDTIVVVPVPTDRGPM